MIVYWLLEVSNTTVWEQKMANMVSVNGFVCLLALSIADFASASSRFGFNGYTQGKFTLSSCENHLLLSHKYLTELISCYLIPYLLRTHFLEIKVWFGCWLVVVMINIFQRNLFMLYLWQYPWTDHNGYAKREKKREQAGQTMSKSINRRTFLHIKNLY